MQRQRRASTIGSNSSTGPAPVSVQHRRRASVSFVDSTRTIPSIPSPKKLRQDKEIQARSHRSGTKTSQLKVLVPPHVLNEVRAASLAPPPPAKPKPAPPASAAPPTSRRRHQWRRPVVPEADAGVVAEVEKAVAAAMKRL